MTFEEYRRLASRTMPVVGPDPTLHVAILAMGLAGESGEVVEMVKKWAGHGHALDCRKLQKELGDVLWYIAALATMHDLNLEDIARENIEKLRARYPAGFSVEASRNRREEE